jgi:hypothetical protein
MMRYGILLATRRRKGRQIYIYMFRNLFAEVVFKNDSPEEAAEKVSIVSGLENLKNHLERDGEAYRN